MYTVLVTLDLSNQILQTSPADEYIFLLFRLALNDSKLLVAWPMTLNPTYLIARSPSIVQQGYTTPQYSPKSKGALERVHGLLLISTSHHRSSNTALMGLERCDSKGDP